MFSAHEKHCDARVSTKKVKIPLQLDYGRGANFQSLLCMLFCIDDAKLFCHLSSRWIFEMTSNSKASEQHTRMRAERTSHQIYTPAIFSLLSLHRPGCMVKVSNCHSIKSVTHNNSRTNLVLLLQRTNVCLLSYTPNISRLNANGTAEVVPFSAHLSGWQITL